MEKVFEKKEITKKSENFSKWYTDVILKADLADYAPVKGCMVFRPYGFSIWEKIQKILDQKIKEAGVENAYFPLFIPEKFLKKEKEHIKGFSPELAIVTIGGGEKLKERLVIRPTSETIIYQMFSKWIKSWRDLPFSINQWVNIVRWEKRPRLFLRTTEFLWQEGHTAHANHLEAKKEVERALKMYVDFYRNFLAIDGIFGKKPDIEKFPGALDTFAFEMLMPDGKVLQGCTSHDLGQNFSKVFDIKFTDKKGRKKFVWQTCWGLSTRSIGALIMVHGDDSGLILPPKIAPIQIIIIPIFQGKAIDKKILKECEKIKEVLKDFEVEIDDKKEYSVGWKFNQWELKGVPLRIEFGERELKEKKLTLVRRDGGKKYFFPIKDLNLKVREILEQIQENLFKKSQSFLKENIRQASDFTEFKKMMKEKRGFLKVFWCENEKCARIIKEETKATARCFQLGEKEKKGKCILCKKLAKRKWLFAQAY
jgi:prolyl-tRNA synthetase